MRFILSLLTWYHAETLGTRLFTRFRGQKVGEDGDGNRFYRNADDSKRWVIYVGEPEASKVSADWHGWLHHTFARTPEDEPLVQRSWAKPHHDNLSGTRDAYAPAGSMRQANPVERADYEAWQP